MADPTQSGEYAASAGLPQLAFETWAGQIFWLAITFAVLYFLLSRVALPPIRDVLENRRDKIADDLDDAAQLSRQAKAAEKAFQATLTDARAKAHAMAAEARASVDAQIAEEAAAADADAAERTAAAEERIRAAADEAMAGARTIAANAAEAIVTRLGAKAPSSAQLTAAVNAADTAQS